MTPKECSSFEECGAPLCPLDKDSLKYGQWFPNEEICRRRSPEGRPRWVEVQHRVVKQGCQEDRYFTYPMLEGLTGVRKETKGLDPERLERIAGEIARGAEAGREIAVVLGAGNFLRGAQLERAEFDRVRGDHMGMSPRS